MNVLPYFVAQKTIVDYRLIFSPLVTLKKGTYIKPLCDKRICKCIPASSNKSQIKLQGQPLFHLGLKKTQHTQHSPPSRVSSSDASLPTASPKKNAVQFVGKALFAELQDLKGCHQPGQIELVESRAPHLRSWFIDGKTSDRNLQHLASHLHILDG